MKQLKITRRRMLQTSAMATLALGTAGCPAIIRSSQKSQRIIVLGMDGMDPRLLRSYIIKGLMPNCRRLISMGGFSPIKTSEPPQSPVAWSNFVSGTNPGGHGIFDFIARDAETITPFLSTSRLTPSAHTIKLGKFSLPLSSAKTELLRHGPTIWDIIANNGIPSTAIKAPVNFPAPDSKAKTLSGLTTPDIHGSYGIFSFYTTSPDVKTRDTAGGHIEHIIIENGSGKCLLPGPENTCKKHTPNIDIPFKIELDRSLARISIQDKNFILRAGEWSNWITLDFQMIPLVLNTSGICRFYLRKIHPHFELYVSPININPQDASMPIATPDHYIRELTENVGPFYTQGMPEDTAALSAGIFDDDDFREQAVFVLKERMHLFENEINNYKEGFFYFYFSSLDLNTHAFWRAIDPLHPLYTKKLALKHGDFIPWLYSQLDQAVGRAMREIDDNTLLFVLSDHGFTSFGRQFNLNSWLMDNGYASPLNPLDRGQTGFYGNTDWSQTKAYGLGINSLYINVRSREPKGIVSAGNDFENLQTELIKKLTAIRDPQTGNAVISHVYRPQEIYSGPYTNMAPDLTVCYNQNYRASWDTILGKYSREVLSDNLDPWSGDHCMDSLFVPGVLLCNKKWNKTDAALADLAPTIISSYNIPVPDEMTGRNLFI